MNAFRFLAAAFFLAVMGLSHTSAGHEKSDGALDVAAYLELRDMAQAKSSAKEWAQAAELWTRAAAVNPLDVKLWIELARARYQARDFAGAIAAYKKVLELGAGLPSVPMYNIACCHALAGNKKEALEWLDKSFRAGFREFERARTDPDLTTLHDEPRFRDLTASADTGKMTRAEGWRFDLALLTREVKRRGYDPFRQVTREQFDAAAKRLEESIPSLSDVQIFIEMTKLMKMVGDGHSGIISAPHSNPAFVGALPLKFYLFKEGLYVVAADMKFRELLGAEILRFDDRSVSEVVAAINPLIHRDNDIWIDEVAPFLMRYPALLNGLGLTSSAQQVTLNVRDSNGKQRAIVVPAQMSATEIWNVRPHPNGWTGLQETLPQPVPLYLKNIATPQWFEYLPESRLLYCQYNQVLDAPGESLADFAKRLFQFIDDHDVDRLVIDLRWNNGGNTALNEPFLHQLIGSKKVNRRGKLFVIIGRRTFSAAQNTSTLIERHTEAIFVGEPTGSNPNFIGEGVTFTLPYSKVLVSVSDLYWQSGWPRDRRKWIAPLLYTPPTFAAYRVNRDPAMEAILAYPAGR